MIPTAPDACSAKHLAVEMGNCTTAITFAWLVGSEVAQPDKDATSGRKHLFGCAGGVSDG